MQHFMADFIWINLYVMFLNQTIYFYRRPNFNSKQYDTDESTWVKVFRIIPECSILRLRPNKMCYSGNRSENFR